jgi:hypothetical protein
MIGYKWQDLVNAAMKHHTGDNARSFLVGYETNTFSRRTLFHGVSE